LALVVVAIAVGVGVSAPTRSAVATANYPSDVANGPLTPAQTKGRTLVVATWGGGWTAATDKYFFEPFAKEYGVKIVLQDSGNGFLTPTITQEKTGNVTWDLLDSAGNATSGLNVLNYTDNYPPWLIQSLTADSVPGTVHSYFVQYGNSADILACNPSLVAKCPTNAQQFFDVKDYPGTRAVDNGDPQGGVQYALESVGVPRYSIINWDLPRAFNILGQLKPHVAVWTTSGSQMVQVMADKTVGMEIMWESRVNALKKLIPNLQVSWDSATTDSEGWVVPAGAPNADLALTFIGWWGKQQQAQANWLKVIGAVVPGKDVASLVSKATADTLPTAHGVHAVPAFDNWGALHSQEIAKDWLSFLAGVKTG
jgi:putative spermidine/putrescine transport system substrate-binding protein